MDLDSSGARRVIGVFGSIWNAAILVVVMFSEGPLLWKAAFVVYGGFALIVFGRALAGKDDPRFISFVAARDLHRCSRSGRPWSVRLSLVAIGRSLLPVNVASVTK